MRFFFAFWAFVRYNTKLAMWGLQRPFRLVRPETGDRDDRDRQYILQL